MLFLVFMLYDFKTKKLADLYQKGTGPYPQPVIKAFAKKIFLIKNAKDEGDLRALKSNHFEKMRGKKDQYSIRLNSKYRLIFKLLKDGSCKIVLIEEISNHYS